MIKKMDQIGTWVYKISGIVIGCLLALITIMATLQVISRFVFSFSIDFAQELVIFLLVWLVFIGTSMGVREGSLITLTIVLDRLPKKLLFVLDIISKTLLIGFFIVTIISNGPVMKFGLAIKLPTLKLPYAYLLVSYSVSAVIMTYYLIVSILKSIAALPKVEAPKKMTDCGGEE